MFFMIIYFLIINYVLVDFMASEAYNISILKKIEELIQIRNNPIR